MFFLHNLERRVTLHPSYFGKNMHELVTTKLLKDVEGRIAQLTSLSQLRTIEACSEAPVHGGYSKLVPHLLLAYQGLFAAVALAAFVASCVYVGDTLAERERAQKIEEKRAQRRAEKEARAAAEKAEEKRRHEQQDHRSRRPRRPPVTPRAL